MKKVSLFLLMMFVPIVSFAECEGPRSGDFEFSQCTFLGQNLSSAVKKFWGYPKVSSSEPLSGDNSADGFILQRAWQCGHCASPNNSTSAISWARNTGSSAEWLSTGMCNNSAMFNYKDDQILLAYVATDVSAHGAKFCLTQFSAASWAHPQFYVYHQIPSTSVEDKLKCAWYCEPGWDGDRCETQGIPDTYEDMNVKDGANSVKALSLSAAFSIPECQGCLSAANRTVVLDYKKVGKREQPGKWSTNAYQQEIVIGATSFMDHGIKARPMLLGAHGGHSECYNSQVDSIQTCYGENKKYTDCNARKYLDRVGTSLYAATAGGTEKVLCLQGYTRDANCVKYEGVNGRPLTVCDRHKNLAYDPNKHSKVYDFAEKCYYYQCRNNMSLYEEDNYSCSLCKNTAREGFCNNECKICNQGECLNMETCKCGSCAAIVDRNQMKLGNNKANECWKITNTDYFRQCVTGIVPPEEEEETEENK